MNTLPLRSIAVTLTVVAVMGLALFALSFERASSAAQPGTPAYLQTATTTEVGPDENILLFASTSQCNSRVITTLGQEFMLIFGDPLNGDVSSTTLSGTVGHLQNASTTVAYDAAVYGCGAMYGYASGSTTLTISEF